MAPSRRPDRTLDPSSLPRYTVVLVPLPNMDEDKLAVIVCHEGDSAIVMKATSNVALYENNDEAMRGAVRYNTGEACFEKDTVIEPHNYHLVKHRLIDAPHRVIGPMPVDFHGRLLKAVEASVGLKNKERRELLKRLKS